jgi:nucleotide-binding universal stress UspA family protein
MDKTLDTLAPEEIKAPGPAHTLTLDNIVVAVDLSSHSEATARYVAAFAKRFGALINLVHVCPMEPANPFVTAEGQTAAEWGYKAAQETLNGLAQRIREIYPDCEAVVLAGEPAEKVSWLARTLKADLIIIGGGQPGFLGRLFGLDQGPKIMHRAPCPVLVYQEAGLHHEPESVVSCAETKSPANDATQTVPAPHA